MARSDILQYKNSFAQLYFNGSDTIDYNNLNATEVEYGNTVDVADFVSADGVLSISTSDLNKKKIKFEEDGTVLVTGVAGLIIREPLTANKLSMLTGVIQLDSAELITDNDPVGQVEHVGVGPNTFGNVYVTAVTQNFFVSLTWSFYTRVMKGHRLQMYLNRTGPSSTTSTFNLTATNTVITAQYVDFTKSYIDGES